MPPASADVLILGAGLAGLRAALSCLESSPGLRVLVASATGAPSGSSFANQNDALGMHVCLSDAEREAYVREVLALNLDARLSPELLALQAQEGEARLQDLIALGLNFTRDATGNLLGHSSCFSPHSRRAFVFTGLASAYACFRGRLESQGCLFAPGWLAASIAADQGKASGAFLVPRDGGAPLFVAAKAVIVALGGPGRLFAHSMAGPGTPGYSHGLLADAGAAMANQGFLQFMWASAPGRTFWQPAALGTGGYRLILPDGRERAVEDLLAYSPDMAHSADETRMQYPNSLQELCSSRAGHCPFAYGLEDSALDLALASGLDDSGIVRLIQPDGAPLHLAPMAHASNGGAVIDEHGQTSVPGLLACGECATGMHGANRIGGSMVLAAQVFGHRAGLRAARIARDSDGPGASGAIQDELLGGFAEDAPKQEEGLNWLATGLSRYAVLGGTAGFASFAMEVRHRLQEARDWRLQLSLETGLGITSSLPAARP
ncbi:MAG: L-aspartate [Desulfovibrionaceae bacterium]|nr:MAG: L-aspartate [Desulfovibrionaceae bacterium]